MELKLTPSTAQGKKWKAQFIKDGKVVKTVNFGATGYKDYTQHGDVKRRAEYRARHKNDRIDDPMTPGALSWYILWGASKDREKKIATFARHFKLTFMKS